MAFSGGLQNIKYTNESPNLRTGIVSYLLLASAGVGRITVKVQIIDPLAPVSNSIIHSQTVSIAPFDSGQFPVTFSFTPPVLPDHVLIVREDRTSPSGFLIDRLEGSILFEGTVPPPLAKPDAPSINASIVKSDQAGLSWTVPFDGGSPIIDYILSVSGGGFVFFEHVGNVNNFTVTGLTPETDYFANVFAINSEGTGGSSPVFPFTTGSAPTIKPNPVTNLVVSNFQQTTADLAWSSPAANQDSFKLILANITKNTVSELVIGNFVSFGLTGLDPATVYTIGIVAIKNNVESDLSNIEQFITKGVIPPPEEISFIIKTDVPIVYKKQSDTTSLFQAELDYFIAGSGRCSTGTCADETFRFFAQIKDPITNTVLFIAELPKKLSDTGGGFQGTVNFSNNITVTIPQIKVEFFMWDSANIEMSDLISELVDLEDIPPPVTTIPDSPIMNDATLVTPTEAQLNWTDGFDGNSPILEYIIVVRETLSTIPPDTIKTKVPAPANSFLATGLTPDTHYFAFVKAINAVGQSDPNDIGIKEFDTAKIDEPIPNETMTLITAQNFQILNDRVLGDIVITKSGTFDPFFNDLPLTVFTQIKNSVGQVLVLKQNTVSFNDSITEQIVNIDESAFSEPNLTIELIVSDSIGRFFASQVTLELIAPPPDEPDPNTFAQSFTVVEYKSTSLGKSLFAQIQVTKLLEPLDTNVKSFLQVRNADGLIINLESQDIDVAGSNAFAIVYDIPDLNNPTGNITVEHFIQTLDGIPLTPVIIQPAVIDQDTDIEPPEDNFFSKIVGIFTGLTAASILLGKPR